MIKINYLLAISLLFGSNLMSKDKVNTKVNTHKKEFHSVWQKTYGGDEKDKGYDSVALDDGGFFVVGSTKSYGHGREDMLIVKFNKKGKSLIRSTFGGKNRDYANAVTKTSDGNYVAVGASESYSKYGDKDLFIVKFDKNGEKLWQRHFGGDRDDEGYDVVGVKNGAVLVVGYTESYGHGYKDVYFLYIDKNGKEIWSKAIGGKDDEEAKAITISKDGSIFLAGSSRSYGDHGFEFYILKFSPSGKYLFRRTFGGEEDDFIYAMDATKDGGVVVAGSTESFDSKHNDVDIIRFDKNGKIIWHKIYGFKSKEWANAVLSLDDGGFLVAGTTKSFGFGKYDFYLLELNSRGSSRWANVYGGEDRDMAHSLTKLKDGSILVTGETESFGNGDYDVMMIKMRKY